MIPMVYKVGINTRIPKTDEGKERKEKLFRSRLHWHEPKECRTNKWCLGETQINQEGTKA
jgi:hypothetical protein